ncbi:hypothetical protein RM533_12390 [Croceicoccus sp. F390]|uniref:Lipoprotein n=1 Tax=Croceicoccus esteveae TaxID=3075597 RepID=A0ABU2ZL70_9SPHN|nr:hypothetical protein [Croceicoccus sp. F390]MDT0576966.1 hypothetical protein [Croceicoccus sp. F390]
MKLRLVFAAGFALALGACKTPQMPAYYVSRDSLYYLQQMPPAAVSLAPFSGGAATLGASTGTDILSACSLAARDQSNMPLAPASYIQTALAEELIAAGRYAPDAGDVRLAGQVQTLSLSRGVSFGGEWTIGLRLTSSNGAQMQVEEEYRFDIGAFAGPTVCNRAIRHFEPAVRSMLEKAIRSPEFTQLLAARE